MTDDYDNTTDAAQKYEIEFNQWKAEAEIRQRDFESYVKQWIHGNQMLNSIALTATKASLYINGGASVALLAFLGNLIRKSNSDANTSLFAWSLLCFILGVLFSALCSGFHYCNAYCLEAAIHGPDDDKNKYESWTTKWRWIAVITCALSLACFLIGGYFSFSAFLQIFTHATSY